MSAQAMGRALDSQPGHPVRKLILIGLANHAHRDGRNAWAAVSTLATYADCTERTVQRHMTVLLEQGFLREGDQGNWGGDHLVPVHRRSIVYDLAMTDEQRTAWAAQRQGGVREKARQLGAKGGRKGASSRWGDSTSPGTGDNESGAGGDRLTPEGVTDSTAGGDTAVSPEPKTLNQVPEPKNAPGKPDAEIPSMPAPGSNPNPTPRTVPPVTRRGEGSEREMEIRRQAHDVCDRWWAEATRRYGPCVAPGDPRRRLEYGSVLPAMLAGATLTNVEKALGDVGAHVPPAAAWQAALSAAAGHQAPRRPGAPRRTGYDDRQWDGYVDPDADKPLDEIRASLGLAAERTT